MAGSLTWRLTILAENKNYAIVKRYALTRKHNNGNNDDCKAFSLHANTIVFAASNDWEVAPCLWNFHD